MCEDEVTVTVHFFPSAKKYISKLKTLLNAQTRFISSNTQTGEVVASAKH